MLVPPTDPETDAELHKVRMPEGWSLQGERKIRATADFGTAAVLLIRLHALHTCRVIKRAPRRVAVLLPDEAVLGLMPAIGS